ncbi:MAG: hypothetical protein P1U63_01685 [Coxiellaceae bacterium]|nr:hypothetical protein [Coxiellaceae bacterium]
MFNLKSISSLKKLTSLLRKEEVKPAGMVAIEIGQEGMSLVRLLAEGDKGEKIVCPLCQYTRGISQEEFAKSLNNTVEQLGLAGSDCCWVLHANDYRMLMIDRPKVPPTEYAAAAQWLIKDMIDFPAESAVLDAFEPASSLTSQNNKLHVVVAQKEYLKSFKKVIDESGLNLVKITIQEMALRNLMALGDQQPAALLQVGDSRSLIMATENQQIAMMRTINLGLRQLDAGQQEPSRMIEEEQRSLKYYVEQLRQKPPEVTYFAPLLQSHAELAATLSAASIQSFDISKYCEFTGQVSPDEQSRAFSCLGAAWPEGGADG